MSEKINITIYTPEQVLAIRQKMAELRISQRQVAQRAKVYQVMVSRTLAGKPVNLIDRSRILQCAEKIIRTRSIAAAKKR